MSTSVILLSYEEGENLKILIPQIKNIYTEMKEDYEILVIDSMEKTDNTEEIARENNVRYIKQEYPYYGGAYKTAIKYVTKDKILNLDADLSHNPNVIPKMHEMFAKGYDVVIGSRYIKGGISHDTKLSYYMSKILNKIMRICLGVDVKDLSTSYRLYDRKQLENINITRKYYDVQQEIILKMKVNNPKLRIMEIPIEFRKRKYGSSKRKTLRFIYNYIITLCMLMYIKVFNKE